MSKRDDDAASEMEEGMTTSERRRRRRRGAGLRIPSDNVPRRGSGPQEVVAPVPEDPSLAVSIAYSFGDESSEPRRDGAMRVDDLPDIEDLEDATTIAPPPIVMRPDHTPEGSIAGAVRALVDDDVVPDGRTRRMPSVNLEALGLTDLDPDEADASVPAGEVEIDVDDEEVAEEIDHDVEAADERRAHGASNGHGAEVHRATTAPPVPKVAARVEPPVEAGQTLRDVKAPVEEPTRPSTDREEEEELDEAEVEEPAPPRTQRAATVALSEDDLELLEPTPPPQVAPKPPPGLARPPTAEPDTLGEDDVHEVVAPSDAADSGEILADEIFDEVEDSGRAEAVTPPPAATAAPAGPPAPATTTAAGPAGKPPTPPAAAASKRSAARAAAAAAAVAPPDAEARKKRRGKPWFEEVFDEDYLRTLPFLTPQATQAEALMVIDSLGIQPGASVLDVGCGYGRHAMELAARGFHVVGVDLSLPLLLRGADEAQRRGLDINFVHADMREMDFEAQFDGAYCLFSTFGYFDDETNKKTATLIAKALKPGAKIMLEVLNRDYVIGDLPTRVWWEGDGCVVLEEVEFNYFSSRVQSKRSVVFDDGRQIEQEISVRVYSLHEIGKLLHAAGFRVLEVSGSMVTRGRFLGNRSREIIVVAERRPTDPGKTLT